MTITNINFVGRNNLQNYPFRSKFLGVLVILLLPHENPGSVFSRYICVPILTEGHIKNLKQEFFFLNTAQSVFATVSIVTLP